MNHAGTLVTVCISLLLLGGCSSRREIEAVDVHPFSPGSAWIGSYLCPQGATQLTLAIEDVDENTVIATFEFDSSGTSGSFEVAGAFDPSTQQAMFTPLEWDVRPSPTWTMVGMDGLVNEAGDVYSGTITSQGCGLFTVSR